jgi:putative ABC transport system permease protein
MKDSTRHSGIGLWLLSRIISSRRNYGLFGDIEEMYHAVLEEKGSFKAKLWLWVQILRTIPYAVYNWLYWGFVMFKNSFKVTVRNFRRQKLYSFINLLGLAVGLACCILILSYVYFEISYDRFHDKAERIYRLTMDGSLANQPFNLASSNGAIGPALRDILPEVEDVVRFRRGNRSSVAYMDKLFFEEGILWADASIFEVFSFHLISGDTEEALQVPYTAVLTEKIAQKYFGSDNPIGKILKIDNRVHYTVTGIVENVPGNSHLDFDILLSFKTLEVLYPERFTRWLGDFDNWSYLLLQEGADPQAVEEKCLPLIDENMGRVIKLIGGRVVFKLQPLSRIHLHSNLLGDVGSRSDILYVYLFSAIALFILLLACINFMNLSTARSAGRGREVGIRKVHGAVRAKLIRQFLEESLIYAFLSLILALVLVQWFLPVFRSLSGRDLSVPYTEAGWLIPALIVLAVVVGLIAGSYPAFVLASFNPSSILKGNPYLGRGKGRFRGILVVFQFAVSVTLIIGTGVVISQVHYMKNKRLGFDKEHLLVLRITDDRIKSSIEAIKTEFLSLPWVRGVGGSSHMPGWGARHNAVLPEGFSLENSKTMGIIHVDYDYLSALGVKIVEGRNFSREFPADADKSVLINEAAARTFGWSDSLGKFLTELDDRSISKRVIGVVGDFHFMDVRSLIEPLMIVLAPDEVDALMVRLAPGGNLSERLQSLREAWNRVVPSTPFDYYFLDAALESEYLTETRLSRLFSYFSVLAVFIACLGLFGMAAYTTEQRNKEIGIRKVLGASSSSIVLLLSREIGKYIFLANIIAWPLAYWGAGHWLQDFPYRTPFHFWIFPASAALVLTIGFLTTAYQSFKAAGSDPADSLRSE